MENIEEIIKRIDAEQENKGFKEVKKYLKYWYWFLASVLIGVGISFFLFKNSPVTYMVSSRLLAQPENEAIQSILSFDDNSVATVSNNNIENKIGTLRSFAIFKRALLELNWTSTWYQNEILYKRELYGNVPFKVTTLFEVENTPNTPLEIVAINNEEYRVSFEGQIYKNGYREVKIDEIVKYGSPYSSEYFNFILDPGNAKIGESYYLVFNNLNALANDYLSRIIVGNEQPSSNVITISLRGTNIQKEADFINKLTETFIEFDVENRNLSSVSSIEFIDSQIARIRTQLKSAEEESSRYRTTKRAVNLSQEAEFVSQRLEEIDHEKYMLQMQIDYYTNLEQYLDNADKMSEMINPSIVGISDDNLNEKLEQLMELYKQREILSVNVKEKSPSFVTIQREIQMAQDVLNETIKNQLNASKTLLANTEKRYRAIETRMNQLPEKEKELIGIQRGVDLNTELYTYLMQKRAEASIAKASIAPSVQVIDPAMPESSVVVGPSFVKYIGIGFVMGVLIPLLIITVLSLINPKIETREEIEKATSLPVFEGIIKHKYKHSLPVVLHPRSGIAESFRGLKTNINAVLKLPKSKVVSINSLVPEEGKSFISSNLSATIARSKTKTLLIGADLHKPTLHKRLNIKEPYGLSDYFQDEKTFDEIVFETSVPNLYCIHAGPVSPNPSDLFEISKFESLIETARQHYDCIIIDNPPIMLIPDAIVSNSIADISLFVLRINHSHKDEIKQINKIVSFNKINPAAIVINEAPDRGFGYGRKYWKSGYGEYKYKTKTSKA